MATIYRALVTTLLLLWGYVLVLGFQLDGTDEALSWHLRVGLTAVIVAGAVQSLPFAYFLGTHFWIKAFAKASRAGDSWEQRHRQWMKGRAYPWLYSAPFLTMGAAIAGGLVETGRVPHWVHPALILAAVGAQVMALALVPGVMKRNSELMDELAETHRVPKPDTPEMDQLIAEEEAVALPPMFQLSRVLLLFAFQAVLAWAYLRWGTEGFRGVPALPFALASCFMLTLGLGLNARYDPDQPKPAARAWVPALAIGGSAAAVFLAVL